MGPFFTLASLIIPLTMCAVGLSWRKNPPKKISSAYGYRTKRSMNDQTSWDFAQRYCGQLFRWLGTIFFPLSCVYDYMLMLRGSIDEMAVKLIVLVGVQIFAMLSVLPIVEYKLKKRAPGPHS